MTNLPKKIEFANTLRGLAALFVLVHHYLIIFFMSREIPASLINMPPLSYKEVATPFYIQFVNLYPYFDYGAFGVALFFLISGFVIPISINKSRPYEFIINRIFRILPVYFFGFSITLIMLWIGGLYFGHHFPYTLNEILVHYIPGLRDILHSKSIDGIIWTLEIEVKFYLICVLVFFFFKNMSLKVFFIPFILGVSALLVNSTDISYYGILKIIPVFFSVIQYIIFMFIGVVFNYLYHNKINFKTAYSFIVIYLSIFMFIDYMHVHTINFSLIVSYISSLFLFNFAFFFPSFFKSNRLVNYFADISYPLYVIHGVSGFVLMRIMLQKQFSIHIALLIACIFAFFISTLLHHIIEIRALQAGRRFLKYLQNFIPVHQKEMFAAISRSD